MIGNNPYLEHQREIELENERLTVEQEQQAFDNHQGYFCNIHKMDNTWSKIIIFTGEKGTMVQIGFNNAIYVGGF